MMARPIPRRYVALAVGKLSPFLGGAVSQHRKNGHQIRVRTERARPPGYERRCPRLASLRLKEREDFVALDDLVFTNRLGRWIGPCDGASSALETVPAY
jgi:hypothetical protein